MAMSIIPNLDNSNSGYAFNTTTSAIDYFNTDSNFPLAEFCAKLDDDSLQNLIDIFNKIYDTEYTLNGVRNTSPTGDCLKMYNTIKVVPGYKRLLYNYALPLINLAILQNKFNKTNLTNPLSLESMYPTHNNLFDFTHTAVEKLFTVMIQEGRTYNEMSLQMFGSTYGDGLDIENKLDRLIAFWTEVFGRTKEDKDVFRSLYQDYSNVGPLYATTPLFLNAKMYTVIDPSLPNTSLGRYFPASPTFVPFTTFSDIISYFQEFTAPSSLVDVNNSLFSVRNNATDVDIINFLKTLFPGYYDTFVNESSLSIVPYSTVPFIPVPIPNPVIYRNCYSLNFSFNYGSFSGPPPSQAVTYGDYLLLIMHYLDGSIIPAYTASLTSTDLFTYADLVTLVTSFASAATPLSLLPSMVGFDCDTLFGVTSPPVFNKIVTSVFSDIISFGYDASFVSHLLELFNYIPLGSVTSFATVGPIVVANVNNVKNFYNTDAIIDLFTNNTIRHRLFRNNTSATSNFFNGVVQTNKTNQVIGLIIFSLLAQEYSNMSIDIFNNKEYAIGYEGPLTLVYYPQFYTLSGNLLTMTKATCILMDRLYCHFVKLFEPATMVLYNGTFTENNLNVSLVQTLLGINPLLQVPKSDPIDYMGFLSFSILVNYNGEFIRELLQDLACNFLFDINIGSDGNLISRINNIERRLNFLSHGNNSMSAHNSFNSYKNINA
jgi:hypothetical protein